MDPVSMIQIKRGNQRPHTGEELEWWIEEYTAGKIPEYQMSAWLMAVCWRGMTAQETATLTRCMVQSGEQLQWKNNATNTTTTPILLVDKHSTGGVGDKISLILAPLVACLGMNVPMMAGRGLGHTGGTIDKLESIPGYQTSLSVEQFQSIVQSSDVGCSIVSPNQALCPADRKLYALRDVTATVSSIPLQTASIMSKKIAENPDFLVLDVKYGRASFQDSVAEAEVLSHSMIATGLANGVDTTAFLTRMDHPIGQAVGNWLEVYECLQLMKTGTGASDLIHLVVVQAAQMIQPKYPDLSWDELVDKTLSMLQSGAVYTKFRQMVEAQGGNVTVLDECPPNSATFVHDVLASQDGFVSDIDALQVGLASVKLGAGRTEADHAVDAAAGIWLHCRVGDPVTQGTTKVATIYTNLSQSVLDQAIGMVQSAIQYSSSAVNVPPVISHQVRQGGEVEVFTLPTLLENMK